MRISVYFERELVRTVLYGMSLGDTKVIQSVMVFKVITCIRTIVIVSDVCATKHVVLAEPLLAAVSGF